MKTHNLPTLIFFPLKLLRDNEEKCDRARQATGDSIVRRVCVGCWKTEAIDTHTEYVILVAVSQQQRLRERASVLRLYVHCLSCLTIISLLLLNVCVVCLFVCVCVWCVCLCVCGMCVCVYVWGVCVFVVCVYVWSVCGVCLCGLCACVCGVCVCSVCVCVGCVCFCGVCAVCVCVVCVCVCVCAVSCC